MDLSSIALLVGESVESGPCSASSSCALREICSCKLLFLRIRRCKFLISESREVELTRLLLARELTVEPSEREKHDFGFFETDIPR